MPGGMFSNQVVVDLYNELMTSNNRACVGNLKLQVLFVLYKRAFGCQFRVFSSKIEKHSCQKHVKFML